MNEWVSREAGKRKVRTERGSDIYCALDLYHHSEKHPRDPGASRLTPHFTGEETGSERWSISPRVTQLVTDKGIKNPAL